MSFDFKSQKLREVIELVIDNRGKNPKEYSSTGIPVIDNYLITSDGQVNLDEVNRFIDENTYNSFLRKYIQQGDVLMTLVGNGYGKVAITPKEKCAIIQNTVGFRCNNDNSNKFLYYLLRNNREIFMNLNRGAAQPSIKVGDILELELQFPSKTNQEHISSILVALDDRISLLRETNATLEAIAQALFKSWFVNFDPVRARMEERTPEGIDEATAGLFPDSFEESELGLMPKGWKVGRVADIGEVICGKTPPTSEPANYGDDVPFITIPDMHNLLVITSTNRALSSLGANTQKKKTLPIGSVCVSCIATAGLVARVTTPSQTNQQINSVVPLAKWGKSFPLFTLRRIGDAVRAGGSGGSVFHNLNKSGFEQLKVLFPSEELALVFNEKIEPIVERIIANQVQIETVTALRDTLLPRLISGQLRLPDAINMIDEVQHDCR